MTTLLGLKLIDLAMIAGYFGAVMAIGFWASRKVKSEDDFFLGGRKFGKALLTMHWLCTGTHSEMAVQVAGATARVGLGGHLVPVDVALLDAVLLADRSHHAQAPGDHHRRLLSHPLRQEPGDALRPGGPFLLRPFDRAACCEAPARRSPGRPAAPLPPHASVIVLSILFSTYVLAGGLVAAAYTDFLQGLLIIALSVLLVPAGLGVVGGLSGPAREARPGVFRDHRPARSAGRRPLVRGHDVDPGPCGRGRAAARHDGNRLGQDRDRGAGGNGLRQLHQAAADDRLGVHRLDRTRGIPRNTGGA